MRNILNRLGLGIALASAICVSGAADTITINFETQPSLPQQPNNFSSAGPMQTYSLPGVYSISGGVVLGDPSGLGSFPAHGSPPNLYGTTDIADPSLLSTITLGLPNATGIVTNVAGVLFNGQPDPETYNISYYEGSTLLGTVGTPLLDPASSPNSWAAFNISGAALTQLTFTAPDASTNGWDFLVDNVQLTITPEVTSVAEPESMVSMALGLGLLVWVLSTVRRRRV